MNPTNLEPAYVFSTYSPTQVLASFRPRRHQPSRTPHLSKTTRGSGGCTQKHHTRRVIWQRYQTPTRRWATQYRDALWNRLGLLAPVEHSDCLPSPSEDPLGFHRLGCKSGASARLRRSNALATVVATCPLKEGPRAFQVEREVGFDGDYSRARSSDVSLDLGDDRTLFDVTVANPSLRRLSAHRATTVPRMSPQRRHTTTNWKSTRISTPSGRRRLLALYPPRGYGGKSVWRTVHPLAAQVLCFLRDVGRGRRFGLRGAHGLLHNSFLEGQLGNTPFVPRRRLSLSSL